MSTPTPNRAPDDLQVWILAGQSNMFGCGLLEGALEPDARVWNFSSAGNWEVAEEPLHRLWESCTPVHQSLLRETLGAVTLAQENQSDAQMAQLEAETRANGAGLGIAFGKEMAEATGQSIGLISAAHGGTNLDNWEPCLKSEGGHSLYGALLQRVQMAGGNLRGVLWYQGESDGTPEFASHYATRFANWIQSLREDLRRPDLPVIAVQIGRVVQAPNLENGWDKTSWEIVREAQRLLPETVPHTAVTSAIDLPLEDAIHINTPGLIRLGKRMAHLAVPLQAGSTPSAPRVVSIERGALHPLGFGKLRVICENVNGGWNPVSHQSGFSLCDENGAPLENVLLLDASADKSEPNVINLLFSAPPETKFHIAYGLGLNPYCNVVDNADQPLLAFVPQPIVEL
jgi:sialate O-acetylesterase